ncbi:PREDICTED: uncharacterized protein LOC104825138 [Tarenaya hassleriana]|uniref:uncharacterized protein LOC104825138 n=1 Tax=Tarenaya hassleriana TaxID=28532 RepID=UPI00053C1DC3|nr:PREDICTED: uncharacterized protein LOC104825138 [Tarenaya hassleriana]
MEAHSIAPSHHPLDMPMMESSKAVTIWIMTMILTLMTIAAQQQQQQPPPSMPGEAGGCSRTFFSALVQLIPCRAAVAPFSPVPPTEACCSAVVTLGRPCLCLLANGPPLSGIDRSMALQLPQRCSTNFPPCEVIN